MSEIKTGSWIVKVSGGLYRLWYIRPSARPKLSLVYTAIDDFRGLTVYFADMKRLFDKSIVRWHLSWSDLSQEYRQASTHEAAVDLTGALPGSTYLDEGVQLLRLMNLIAPRIEEIANTLGVSAIYFGAFGEVSDLDKRMPFKPLSVQSLNVVSPWEPKRGFCTFVLKKTLDGGPSFAKTFKLVE